MAIFVAGKRVESLNELEKYITGSTPRMEIRNDAGTIVGMIIPENEPICPWEPTLDQAEIDRRMKGKCYSTAEVLKRLGE